jgi:hypothetical protein
LAIDALQPFSDAFDRVPAAAFPPGGLPAEVTPNENRAE